MTNTKNRLAIYKKRATESRFQTTWKNCRHGFMHGYKKSAPQFTTHEGVIYADNFEVIGDKVGDAHEFVRMNHTGYFCDIFCDGVIRGAVVKLRTSKGTYYIPATYCTEWDGVTLYLKNAEIVVKSKSEDDHEMAIVIAARSADHYAEREAEKAREDSEKDQAQQRCEEYREEITKSRANVRDLIAEIKQHGAFSPAICSALRKTLRTEWGQVQNLRESVRELTASPWMISEYR